MKEANIIPMEIGVGGTLMVENGSDTIGGEKYLNGRSASSENYIFIFELFTNKMRIVKSQQQLVKL